MTITHNNAIAKQRLLGVGFFHWYVRLTDRFTILPKLSITHDPDALSRGRVVSGPAEGTYELSNTVNAHTWDVLIP